MKGLYQLAHEMRTRITHPIIWLIAGTLCLGLFRASTIPDFHNYDEYSWHKNILTTRLADCLFNLDCETVIQYIVPSFSLTAPTRGGPYFLAQAFFQQLLTQGLRDNYSLLTTRSFTE